MDAEESSSYPTFQDVHPKDSRTLWWKGWWPDIACYQGQGVRRYRWKELLRTRSVRTVDHARRISHGTCALLDGPYGNFAGRDASRGMAKQSFDEGQSMVVVHLTATDRHAQTCSPPLTNHWISWRIWHHRKCASQSALFWSRYWESLLGSSSENMNGMLTLIPIKLISCGICRMDWTLQRQIHRLWRARGK